MITYGDPAYYSKVGFKQINQDFIEPPYELSMPIGWLAQSLVDKPLEPIQGKTQCVTAFQDINLW